MAEGSARGKVERSEPGKAERAASRRVAESKATIPHVYAEVVACIDDASRLFERVVSATATALREVPALNGAYRDGAAERYSRVNVGIATRGSDAAVIPTIFDADEKGVDAIATEWAALDEKAAAGSLTAKEVAGGTFTVQPAGPVRSFTPVISGGQAANLGFGEPVDGQLVLTLAADARVIDAPAIGKFFEALRRSLEGGHGSA